MNRFTKAIVRASQRIFEAVERFPLTVICLVCTSILICYMISLHKEPDLITQKLMFTFLLGSFLGVAAQFTCERFDRLLKMRIAVYGVSALITVGYYLIILAAPSISFEVVTRTFVAVFAMFCAFLWVPSYQSKSDFNGIALTHFKSAFTSVLFSGVLSGGCASIIAAIDILLFKVNSDSYGYMMTIIWVLFATLYYLSLLPRYNSEYETEREYAQSSALYPRFLEILISYIAIPLVATYTLVLAAYFIKILVTFKWPSGQLGVMVLAYSAAGLTIYVLSSRLENHFAKLYRLIFPKVLIPVVIMQLISVAIRLNAYGITESRYYVTLFGVFSLVCGVALSFKPVSKNGIIALLAAGFAIFSVIPPVDAFTVSRVSQITRLESMLKTEGILADGIISPKAEVPMNLRLESTSILAYLDNRSYIKYIKWLPGDFKFNNDKMKSTLGFEPAYGGVRGDSNYFFANIDMQKPLNISGYDILINTNSNRGMDKSNQPSLDFEVSSVKYKLSFERLSPQEVLVSVKNTDGVELVGTGLYDFTKTLSGIGNNPKEALAPEKMTIDVEKDGYKLRIMLQNVNVTYGTDSDSGVDYSIFVMFGAPASAK
ncbi:MAG: DUF4153 domain-containing protein [Firmicutes bacterium HGW-Firmicutes-15]|nr:MAG: DUF4153 domain-containing protein [Firmicutes bacterium HGW-Firmicutes-15]